MAASGLVGTASLVEQVDKKLVVILRDGKKVYGVCRTFDHFANIVLERAVQRIFVDNVYAEVPVGVFLIRGENVALFGELDPNEEEVPSTIRKVSYAEIMERIRSSRSVDKWRELDPEDRA